MTRPSNTNQATAQTPLLCLPDLDPRRTCTSMHKQITRRLSCAGELGSVPSCLPCLFHYPELSGVENLVELVFAKGHRGTFVRSHTFLLSQEHKYVGIIGNQNTDLRESTPIDPQRSKKIVGKTILQKDPKSGS